MNDIINFRLSKEANDVADQLVATGKFDHGTSAAKFAFAYAVKNYYGHFDPATYAVTDGFGTNYSVGSFNDLAPYVLVLYPQTETPYIYVRALINYGLVKIGEIIKEKGMPAIYSLCD
ncbi:MAG: hypothetical protein E7325_08305 [Clostridiales bacterium]|jgi:hypothetical protein|nr:hypothetical protein [Clostridiales bacterium]MBR4576697.1 hypothetical protein [Clostridia bacterium]